LISQKRGDENGNPWLPAKVSLSDSDQEKVKQLTNTVVVSLGRNPLASIPIEDVQDQVELALMRSGEHQVARGYVLYRQMRREARGTEAKSAAPSKSFLLSTGQHLDPSSLLGYLDLLCAGLSGCVPQEMLEDALPNLYDGVSPSEVDKSLILSVRTKMEKEPNYGKVGARLLLQNLREEVLEFEVSQNEAKQAYQTYFPKFIRIGIEAGLLDQRLAQFDLEKLAAGLDVSPNLQFSYIGFQTLYDRYFLHIDEKRIELSVTGQA
jgi:ribonucleoside-diphosphate reductase alpha chain